MTIHNTKVLMHDGAPCHRSKLVSKWLTDNSIEVLHWPGNSPDCNPIENLWNTLKNEVAKMQPSSLLNMQECIKIAWSTKITQDYCQKLVHSMPRRLAAVIQNKGFHTGY